VKPKKHRYCRLCLIRDSLNQFECLLFAKKLDEKATVTEGLENPSMEISFIKCKQDKNLEIIKVLICALIAELNAVQTERSGNFNENRLPLREYNNLFLFIFTLNFQH